MRILMKLRIENLRFRVIQICKYGYSLGQQKVVFAYKLLLNFNVPSFTQPTIKRLLKSLQFVQPKNSRYGLTVCSQILMHFNLV